MKIERNDKNKTNDNGEYSYFIYIFFCEIGLKGNPL